VPFTSGFDPAELADHFKRHKADFGCTTPEEYEAQADLFLGGPLPAGAFEGIRINSRDVVRFNPNTNEFGIVSRHGVIRTYYKPKPRRHGFGSNYQYFLVECRKS